MIQDTRPLTDLAGRMRRVRWKDIAAGQAVGLKTILFVDYHNAESCEGTSADHTAADDEKCI